MFVLAFLTLGTSCSRLAGLHSGRESVGDVSRPRRSPACWSLVTDGNPQLTSSPQLPGHPVPDSHAGSTNQLPDSLQRQLHGGGKESPRVETESHKVAGTEFPPKPPSIF